MAYLSSARRACWERSQGRTRSPVGCGRWWRDGEWGEGSLWRLLGELLLAVGVARFLRCGGAGFRPYRGYGALGASVIPRVHRFPTVSPWANWRPYRDYAMTKWGFAIPWLHHGLGVFTRCRGWEGMLQLGGGRGGRLVEDEASRIGFGGVGGILGILVGR